MPGRDPQSLDYALPTQWHTVYTGNLTDAAAQAAVELAMPAPPSGHKWVITSVFAYHEDGADLDLYFNDDSTAVMRSLLGATDTVKQYSSECVFAGSVDNVVSVSVDADGSKTVLRLALTGYAAPA